MSSSRFRVPAEAVALVVALLAVAVALTGCSSPSYEQTSEPVSLVVHEGRPCNVSLRDDQRLRHGLVWESKSTVEPTRAPPGVHEGSLTYESDEVAWFEGSGIVARFRGRDPDTFATLNCPGRSDLWNPDGTD